MGGTNLLSAGTNEAEGISIDEIQIIFQDSFGVNKSLELRKEKDAIKRRLHDLETGATASVNEDEKNLPSQVEL